MLSLGLKNAILVVLIILIIHFLIKNAIIEKKKAMPEKFEVVTPPATKTTSSSNTPTIENVFKSMSAPLNDQGSKSGGQSQCQKDAAAEFAEATKKDKSASEKAELLKYVYGEEGDDDISKFFTGLDVTRDVESQINDKINNCPLPKNDDMTMPLNTTCDAVSKIAEDEMNSKRVKAECNLSQPLQTMVVKEYENENAMNGGKLYDDLSAYDNLSAFNFSDL